MPHDQDRKLDLRHHRPDQHPQCILDLQTKIYKIFNQKRVHNPQKVRMLEELADKFKQGWPFGRESRFASYGQFFLQQSSEYANFLERQARALAHRLHSVDLVRSGRNVGTVDKTELDSAKVYSTEQKKETK